MQLNIRILIIIALVFVFASCANDNLPVHLLLKPEIAEPLLRFGIISDIHIGYNGRESLYIYPPRLAKVLQWYNTQSGVKTVVMNGDIVQSGTQEQWDTFTDIWETNKGKLQLIAVFGNHEAYPADLNVAADRFENATGQKLNAHYVIDGYHFITVTSGSGNFNDQETGDDEGRTVAAGRADIPGTRYIPHTVPESVKTWLRGRIDYAKTEAPGQPVFVFLHWAVQNTYLLSDMWYAEGLGNDPYTGFFRDDPEVIVFGGHSHAPNNDPRSIWQGGFTAVNVPPLLYIELGPGYLGDNAGGTADSPFAKIAGWAAGQGLIVSVRGSKVTIENYDFDFSEGLQPLNNIVKIPQTWEFDITKPDKFPYTRLRDTRKSAPVFNSNASIRIKNIESTSAEVEFDQARIPAPNYNNETVYSYRFDFINKATGNIDRQARQWSDFMLTPRLQKPVYSQIIGGLKSGADYELRIYAYGSFQECSVQYLSMEFSTNQL